MDSKVESPDASIEVRVSQTGDALLRGLSRVMDRLPEAEAGPQKLAARLGVDKVLTSRLLKALRAPDPITVLHRTPGPEPLRRVLKSSAKLGVPPEIIAEANEAVDRFEAFVRSEVGDRSSLEALLCVWVPEARREFELRRKQHAYRAMSQLRGVEADVSASTGIFWPSSDGKHVDIYWLYGLHGLRKLRPGVVMHFTSLRKFEGPEGRVPVNLDGDSVESPQGSIVREFSSDPTPTLRGELAGETTHYFIEGTGYGSAAIDVMTCEVNRDEIPRYLARSRGRRSWAAHDINIPVKRGQFDMLVHEDLYPGEHPELTIYDTTIRGLADLNDRTRDIDRLDLLESIEHLGIGLRRFGSSHVPRYRGLLTHVCERLGLDGERLRGYRVATDYPIYGSQIAMSLRTTDPPLV